MFMSYMFINPYRVVRKYLQKRGESNPYQYGETPLMVIDKLITKAGGIAKYQHFGDLGAGRGRLSYFIKRKFGCQVFAFEQVSLFAQLGKKIFPKITYVEGDFLSHDISSLDVIYLYGTMMKEKEILSLTKKIGRKTKVITISYPLSAYDSRFEVLHSCSVSFPWGKTKGYIQCQRK